MDEDRSWDNKKVQKMGRPTENGNVTLKLLDFNL